MAISAVRLQGGEPLYLSIEAGAPVQSLPLGPGDLVYVSPFVADADSPYAADAQAAGLHPLEEAEIEKEEARFRAATVGASARDEGFALRPARVRLLSRHWGQRPDAGRQSYSSPAMW